MRRGFWATFSGLLFAVGSAQAGGSGASEAPEPKIGDAARAAPHHLSAAKAVAERGRQVPAAGRMWSRGYTTWIWSAPRKGSKKLGYVRVGTSVALLDREPIRGAGCPRGFRPVAPQGFVCLDRTTSLDTEDRYLRSMALVTPGEGALPYRYALSNGAPMYRRLPTRREAKSSEIYFGKPGTFAPLSWGNRGHEKLAEVRRVDADSPAPFFLSGGGAAGTRQPLDLVRRHIPLGSMLAYTRAFEHDGRTWLLSADGTIVPADRVRPFRESTFEGVELDDQTALPIAWVRKWPRPKYRREGDQFVKTDSRWEVRSFTRLEVPVKPVEFKRLGHRTVRYLKTLEKAPDGASLYIAESHATVVKRRKKLPFGVTADDKWILVSIRRGTLVAYQGREPVFATLISPGAGGVPVRGKDPVKMSTTPLGIYRVTFKHKAATMSPEKGEDRSFWIADVPYTQYFHAPFALHVAYWHENFGEGMSAGCINLSPKDGKRLFGWTGPKLPEGWNGVAASKETGRGTFVVVTR